MLGLTTALVGVALFGATSAPQGQSRYEERLLPIGAAAPAPELKTNEGKEVKFAEIYKKNKATLLNFWFYN